MKVKKRKIMEKALNALVEKLKLNIVLTALKLIKVKN